MNVREIIKNYLQTHNYGGLVNQEVPCGCLVEDLAPCGEECIDLEFCESGYVHNCDDCSFAEKGKDGQLESNGCDVEDHPGKGDFCVGTTKEITRDAASPPEPWITEAKLQDTVEFYMDISLEKKARGIVKIISPDHHSLRVLEEGMGMLARVTPEIFIRIVKPKEKS